MVVGDAVQIRARRFGVQGKGTHAVWPQDIARAAGLGVVPGLIIDATLPDKASVRELQQAVEMAMPSISHGWRRMMSSGVSHEERAIIEVRSCPVTPSPSRSLVLAGFERPVGPALQGSKVASEMLRDLCMLCLYFNPAFESALMGLQDEALSRAHAKRIGQLTDDEIWDYMRGIMSAYREATGMRIPKTPIEQLALVLLYIMQHLSDASSIDTGRRRFVSLCIRLRPLRLPYPESGSGVVLCGPGTEQLDRRGSYAPSTGLDYIEAGMSPVLPVEQILSEPGIAEKLDRISQACVAGPGGSYHRLSFVLDRSDLLVDTMVPVTPTAEILIAGAAAQMRQGDAPLLESLTSEHIRSVLYPQLKPNEDDRLAGEGIPVAPGACSGVLATSIATVTRYTVEGLPVIFAATSPTPEALEALSLSAGAVFRTGGVTSHVAVIARGLGKPCVLGVDGLEFPPAQGFGMKVGQTHISEGQWISIDGTTGRLYLGQVEAVRLPLESNPSLLSLLDGCDARGRMSVYVNADSGAEASEGFRNGAKGVGLCRIEHMLATAEAMAKLGRTLVYGLAALDLSGAYLLSKVRSSLWYQSEATAEALRSCRQTVLQSTPYARFVESLTDLKVVLERNLRDLFAATGTRPVTIRFLDPPLSEFLSEGLIDELLQGGSISPAEAESSIRILDSCGGMLGLRGIRLGLVLSELTEMQALAVSEAALITSANCKSAMTIGIMAPFITDPLELQLFRVVASRCLAQTSAGPRPEFSFGGMIETPRAVMMAGELARIADFLSFGTNDLSQFVWASSRDSAESGFLRRLPYAAMDYSPFTRFDEIGVGRLIAYATERARAVKPVPMGVCGEHAQDEKALGFFADIGIDYVSCVPFAVPEVRLAVARSARPGLV